MARIDASESDYSKQILEAVRRPAAVGEMAARIAHRVNNPLASIKNATALLRDSIREDHPGSRFLDMIENEADRAAQAMAHLIDVHTPELARSQEFCLSRLLSEMIPSLRTQADSAGVSLIMETIDPTIRPVLPSNLLREVVFRLLENAIAMSPRGGEVKIEARVDDSQLRIMIRESGPERSLEETSLRREQNGTTKERCALEFGLAICQDLASAMRGTVTRADFDDLVPAGTSADLVVPIRCANDR